MYKKEFKRIKVNFLLNIDKFFFFVEFNELKWQNHENRINRKLKLKKRN